MFVPEIREYIETLDPEFASEMKSSGLFDIWLEQVDKWAQDERARVNERSIKNLVERRGLENIKSNPDEMEYDYHILELESDEIVRHELKDMIKARAFVLEKVED
ncbi:MAG: hypothetical protein ACOYJI_02540 [Anaerovoracaceae bacterium]|jgi:hypothetical protein